MRNVNASIAVYLVQECVEKHVYEHIRVFLINSNVEEAFTMQLVRPSTDKSSDVNVLCSQIVAIAISLSLIFSEAS